MLRFVWTFTRILPQKDRFCDDIECTTRRSAVCDKSSPTQMVALAISTKFIYSHVVALELTIHHTQWYHCFGYAKSWLLACCYKINYTYDDWYLYNHAKNNYYARFFYNERRQNNHGACIALCAVSEFHHQDHIPRLYDDTARVYDHTGSRNYPLKSIPYAHRNRSLQRHPITKTLDWAVAQSNSGAFGLLGLDLSHYFLHGVTYTITNSC